MSVFPILSVIPIYRCTESDHHATMERKKAELLAECSDGATPLAEAITVRLNSYFERVINYSWTFNEIVGWIELYLDDERVVGDLWLDESKRFCSGIRKKKICYVGKCLEVSTGICRSSVEVFESMVVELNRVASKRRLRKRYVDLEIFTNTGRFLDWKTLVESRLKDQFVEVGNIRCPKRLTHPG